MLKRVITFTIEPIAYAILFLLTIRRIIGDGLISLEQQPFEKTIHEMILWILLMAIFFWLALSKSLVRKNLIAWGKNWLLLIFILFALFSIIWSLNICASIYKGISLIGCSAIAAYTGLTYSNRYVFRGFWWFSIFLTLMTYTAALVFPTVGTHAGYPLYGAWRGIFWSKNYMGPIMVFGNLVFLFSIASSGKKFLPLFVNILFYFLTALSVFLSNCATAIILLVLLNLGFLLVIAWVKWKKFLRKTHYIVLTIVSIVLIIVMFLNLGFLFGLLNRNTTLTGRVPLWSYLIQKGLANRPALGNGFGATWESNNFRSTTESAVGWQTPPLVSDNGYIDIFLDLGFVGVVLLILIVLLCLYRVSRYAFDEQTLISFFPVFVMIFVVVVNIDLSFFLNLETFAWFLMLFALFSTTPILRVNRS